VNRGTKRARQYEHIEQSEKQAGRSEGRAEEIAARLGIEGRSGMSKAQLHRAVAGAES
jgi:hypothetical protein